MMGGTDGRALRAAMAQDEIDRELVARLEEMHPGYGEAFAERRRLWPPWRKGQYWVTLDDPTPAEARAGNAIWAHCHRCGVRENVLLPADLGDVVTSLVTAIRRHDRCPQTLMGARWELLVTLRMRRHQLTQQKKAVF
jgi:hypothetical protein